MDNKATGKIIHQQCKEVLLPLGVFQKGTSRIYIDDNGYFFTVVEFQPSSFAKGTYLNVALHFLWKDREDITYDFSCGPSIRVKDFVEYQDDEQFSREVTKYVAEAKKQILCYRNPKNVKRVMKKIGMIHRINEEEIVQKIRQTRAFWHSKPSMKKMKYYEIYDGISDTKAQF